jgi:hypothetical protein
MRDIRIPVGDIQMPALPVACVDVQEVNASIGSTFDAEYSIDSKCLHVNQGLSKTGFDKRLCENQVFMEGSAVFDTGCVRPLMQTEYEPLMTAVQESMLSISGYDAAAASKNGSKHGQSDMYFMSVDQNRPSKGQGVDNYKFDTVDDLCENLFACSKYYEEGAEIHLTHGASFSGVRGEVDGRAFSIPVVYDHSAKCWLVHYVMARSPEEAERYGKVVQKRMQSNNAINARLADAATISDEGLLKACFMARGNMTICTEDEDLSIDLGEWDANDDQSKAHFARACGVTMDVANEVCRSFMSGTTDETDLYGQVFARFDNADHDDATLARTSDSVCCPCTPGRSLLQGDNSVFECAVDNVQSSDPHTSRTFNVTTRGGNEIGADDLEERELFEQELLDGRDGDLVDVDDVEVSGFNLFDDNYKATDAALHGMKNGLQPKDRKLTFSELHRQKCHMGHDPSCPVCKLLKKRHRRIRQVVDPVKPELGYQWGFDLISWKEESLNGNKYTLVMREYTSGVYKIKHLAVKSQVTEALRSIVTELRADPKYQSATRDYQLVSRLCCDPAGEQRDDNVEFMTMCKEMVIEVIWGDPTDKRSDGFCENAVKQIELTAKAIMADSCCPSSWWELAVDQAADVRNHVPLSRSVKSSDGDTACPIEVLSEGRVSRRSCSNYISKLVMVGTPCWVTDTSTKASDNTRLNRHKPGIAYMMLGTLPVFKSPITGALFRSKNYVKWDAPRGVSAYEFLGCELPSGHKLPSFGFNKDSFDTGKIVVQFDDIGRYHAKAMPRKLKAPIGKATGDMPWMTVTDEHGYIYEPSKEHDGEYRRTTGMIQRLQATGVIEKLENMSERDKQISLLKYDPDSFNGKSVYQSFGDLGVYTGIVNYHEWDSNTGNIFWNITFTDNVETDYWEHEMIQYCIDKVDGTDVRSKVVKRTRAPPAGAVKTDDENERQGWFHQRSAENAADAARNDVSNSTSPINTNDVDLDAQLASGQYIEWMNKRDKRVQRLLVDDTVRQERLEALEENDGVYFCEENDNFKTVCAHLGLDKAQWRAYYDLVHTEYMCGEVFKDKKKYANVGSGFNYPFTKGGGAKTHRFAEGKRFPIPHKDPLWKKMIDKMNEKSNEANDEHTLKALETHCFRMAAWTAKEMTEQIRVHDDEQEIYNRIAATAYAAIVKDESTSTGAEKMLPPKNYREAMQRDDWEDWAHAKSKELEGIIDDRGVLSKESYTLKQLRRMGITNTPMPASMIFEDKTDGSGNTTKKKGRLVQNGTKHNMRRSFGSGHIFETYSAAPDIASNRIMQALMILLGWEPLAFDLVQAYLAADIPDDERVPIRLQKGLQTYNEQGEEKFHLLEGNLYGSPTACRRFVQMRDAWMLERFNIDGWECKPMVAEQSMFRFTTPEGRVVIACIHSDDVDCICENIVDGTFIAEEFNKRFAPKEGSDGIKMVSPTYMLGVQRTVTKDPDTGVTYIEMTQTACIDSLYEEYKTELPKKACEEPVPKGCFLSTHWSDGEKREVDEAEVAKILPAYRSIVGTLLWLARNCFPELSQGVHLLCRVMAQPNDEAYKAALHMVSYVHGQRERGIRFRSDGNIHPVACYDASHLGDYKDSKCIGGYCIMLAGGPITWQSKKAQHVGTSSSADEYMCAFHAAKECKWVRDLLMELDLGEKMGHDYSMPIPLLGDNDQATRWTNHGMITAGNKTVRMNFHWVQEAIKDGIVETRRVATEDNTSDVFTKSLGSDVLQRLLPGLTGYGEIPTIPDRPPN